MQLRALSVAAAAVSFLCACSSSDGPAGEPVCQSVGECGGGKPPPSGDTAELAAPAPGKGVQFSMPQYQLESGTEWEGCFASWFDYTDVVPDEYKSEDGKSFYVDSTTVHQTQGSHHLVILDTPLTAAHLTDESFGAWTCKGGDRDGATCEPLDAESCPGAVCGSKPAQVVACIGYGPADAQVNPASFGLANTAQAQLHVPTLPGVYRKVPLKGIAYWDLHAFNLTDAPRVQHANLNFTFAEDRRFYERRLTVRGELSGVPPFTRKDLCAEWIVPKDTKILRVTSHTHSRGEDFRVWNPAGEQIYQSFVYSDPKYVSFDPPLFFDSDVDSERTITFCSIFNNGITQQGTLDTNRVMRRSKTPDYASSKPVPTACAAGKVGDACDFEQGDAQCDSSEGAGDGACDAAAIQFGETTTAEMFFFLPDVIDPAGESEEGTFGQAGTFNGAKGLPPKDAPY